MSILNGIRCHMQRVTGLIVSSLFLLIPCLMSWIGGLLGLWSRIDLLYLDIPNRFWWLYVSSRIIFGGLWLLVLDSIINSGELAGVFQSQSYSGYGISKEQTDRSGGTRMVAFTVCVLAVIGEVIIRVVTATEPPYMIYPPPR